ncbi:MAG: hypothetical protein ACKVX7_16310 [Planctomycetota bacterium]
MSTPLMTWIADVLVAPDGFFSTPSKAFLLFFGIAVLVFAMARFGRRRRLDRMAASAGARLAGARGAGAPGVQTSARAEDSQQALIRLRETTQELEARLDTRVRLAQRVIAEADRAVERLENLIKLTSATSTSTLPVSSAVVDAVPLFAEQVADPTRAAAGPYSSDEVDSTHQEVARLTDEGHDSSRIAEIIGKPVGEVRLIQALNHSKKHTRA